MDYIPPREQDYAVDLERGGAAGEEVSSPGPASSAILPNTFFSKFRSGFVSNDGLVKGENGLILGANVLNNGEVSPENLKLLIDEKVEGDDLVEKKKGKKKNKKASAKKPPRPPTGLSLDAADQKLIREIAEIAMLKRARIERMKAIKKMKAAKASSSSSSGNLFAMLFTILFCLVILFQGMSSGSSPVGFQGSPESAQGTEGGFIFVSNHWNPYANNTNIPGPGSPSQMEQVAGLDAERKVSEAAG
ncbi:hypothetical protein LguiB_025515 [Lonicera macranthoides]